MEDGTIVGYKYEGCCPSHGTDERKVYGGKVKVAVFSGCKCAVHLAFDNFATYYTSYNAAAGNKEIERQKGW